MEEKNLYAAPQEGQESKLAHLSRQVALPGEFNFQPFDFSRALSLGVGGFFHNLPLGFLYFVLGLVLLFIWLLLVSIASGVVFGLIAPSLISPLIILLSQFLAIPHFLASFFMMGYYLAARRLKIMDLFIGFNRFLPILGAMVLVILLFWAITILALIPFVVLVSAESFMGSLSNPDQWGNIFKETLTATFVFMGSMFVWWLLQKYFMVRFLLTIPLIIEGKRGVFLAFRQSWEATAPGRFTLFAYSLLGDGLLLFLGFANIILLGLFTGGSNAELYSSWFYLLGFFLLMFLLQILYLCLMGGAAFQIMGEPGPSTEARVNWNIAEPDQTAQASAEPTFTSRETQSRSPEDPVSAEPDRAADTLADASAETRAKKQTEAAEEKPVGFYEPPPEKPQ